LKDRELKAATRSKIIILWAWGMGTGRKKEGKISKAALGKWDK